MGDISVQLIDQVKHARSTKTSLNIVGGNTKHFIGRAATGEAVDLSAHQGIVKYEPNELVITVRAGTLVVEVQAALAEFGQALPFDPPHFNSQATIGGTLACDLSGPGRPWRGSARDSLLGLRLINGRGEHLKLGGQVMKNVAGFDAFRLQAGAMGTLGILTELSFKILPKLATSKTLALPMGASAAITAMNEFSGLSQPLTAACWVDGQLFLRLEGAALAVDQAVAQCAGEELVDADKFWSELREQQHEYFSGDLPLWRFSLNSTAELALADQAWLIDWGGAQRWLRGEFDYRSLQALAENAGGQVSLMRGGDRTQDVFHPQQEVLKPILQNLKSAFDPEGLFNPGRLYSWL